FDLHLVTQVLAFQIAITPGLKGIGGGAAAAFFLWPVIMAATGMRVNAVRRAKDDVDPAAVGSPSRNAGGEVLVGVGDAAIVLVLKFVFDGIRSGIAPEPELFNELVALFIVCKLLECLQLFAGDDPLDVILKPLL